MTTEATPREVGSHAGLGLAPERAVVAYLYHDAASAETASPMLHSTLVLMAADRRPTLRNETPLVTLAQAQAMVAAERERLRAAVEAYMDAPARSYSQTREQCDAQAAMWRAFDGA